MLRKGRLIVVLLVAVSVLLTGCEPEYSGKFSGGGFIESMTPGKKATFGFTYDAMSGRFRGAFHDHGEGVRLKGEGVIAYDGLNPDGNCMAAVLAYESLDPKNPGSGELGLGACDYGEPGVGEGDEIAIEILTGPFAAYVHGGTILGGNLQDLD